jgi:tetratricopeptide (TPR) repeat protein
MLPAIARVAGAQVATRQRMIPHEDSTPRATPNASAPADNGRRVRLLLLLALLLMAGALYSWWAKPVPLVPSAPLVTKQLILPAQANKIPTEEQWMASDIANDIAEMLAFAATRKTPTEVAVSVRSRKGAQPREYLFEATMGAQAAPVRTQIILVNYFWAPENFTTLTADIARAWSQRLGTPRSPVDQEIFLRLTTPTPDTLVREDKRLSEALTKAPLDAELHEEAAFLIGSFALRHAADAFYDVRRELSRMSAHLAIARVLDNKGGPCGDLAEAIICTLAERQSAALEILQRLERNTDTPAGLPLAVNTIWSRALTLRNTGDYRKLDQPEHASLLERLEYVRALRYRVGAAAASNFLVHFPAEKLAEWSDLILAGPFSVSEGHMWAARALTAELEEIGAEYRQYHDKALSADAWTSALNEPPAHITQRAGEPAQLAVLGWGSWASLHQRQLCQVVRTSWLWLEEDWGVPEQAAAFKKAVTERFEKLNLLPLVNMDHEPDTNSQQASKARALAVIEAHPDWVSFTIWSKALRASHMVVQRERGHHAHPVFNLESYFDPILPAGTLYDSCRRGDTILRTLSSAQLAQLKAIAPYNAAVLYHQIEKDKGLRATPEEFAVQFEMLTPYDTWPMQVVADTLQADPDRYEPAFLRVCHWEPDLFIKLGDYLVEHQRPEAAAKAYQKAVDHAPNRVLVSNSVGWLVDYYYEHGRRKEAFTVAEMAAEAYSGRGLYTMATLLEKDGQLTQAETYLNKVAERYDQIDELIMFYGRHRRENQRFAEAFDRMNAKLFPKGQEPADVAALSGIPRDGVVLTGMNERAQAAGLKKGDVIVTINGIRVRNEKQYRYLLQSAPSLMVQFGFWSPQKYRSVVINLPERRLGVTIADVRR